VSNTKKTDKSKAGPAELPSITQPAIPPEAVRAVLAAYESFRQYREQNQRLLEQFAPGASVYKPIEDVFRVVNQFKLSELSRTIQSPAFESANAANLSIGRLFESIDIIGVTSLLECTARISGAWGKRFRVLNPITQGLPRNDLTLQSHLADIAKFSFVSQTVLSRLSWDEIGNTLRIQSPVRSALQNSFLGLTASYSLLLDSLEKQPSVIISVPPAISRSPAVEFFNGVGLLDSITAPGHEDVELIGEVEKIRADIRNETQDRLEELLAELDTGLLTPLHGARFSLNAEGPDQVRHFAISLRELFGHVLHMLAPDDEVKAWTQTPDDYHEGRPTRKARLRYICRDINHDPFRAFIEKDIAALLAFLKLFQRGTHEVAAPYASNQLRIMLVRMESALTFLLEIKRSSL